MVHTVGKHFTFHAAHRDEEAGDQCARLHGHTYRLDVSVIGRIPEGSAMLLHGNVLKGIYAESVEPLVEHQYLNETLGFNATMEAVAAWLWETFARALNQRGHGKLRVFIKLWETPTMYSECHGSAAWAGAIRPRST